jgi:hypothetical protein
VRLTSRGMGVIRTRIIGKFSLAGICDSDFDATTKFVILNILSIVLVCNVRNGSGEEIPFSMDK